MQDEPTKRCSRCGETKPLTAFWPEKRRPDGRQTRCAECANRRRHAPPGPPKPDYEVADRGYRTPCWVWQKALDRHGYGVLCRAGKMWLAHRWYFAQSSMIPDGLHLDHLCRVPACVNPSHLEPVTNRENIRRGRGTKLSEQDVRDIRTSSDSARVAAAKYGVHPTYVYNLRSGDKRADVPSA